MTNQKLSRVLISGLALMALLSAAAFGKGSRTINLRVAASLDGTQIEAGQYELSWEEHSPQATVTLSRGKNTVVTAQGRLEERKVKYDSNTMVLDTASNGSQIIREFRPAGTNKAIVFVE
jgi:GH43 family beta-xylosidase